MFLSGIILSAGGYIADAVQSGGVIFAIGIIIGPIPALVFAAAVIVVHFYPLDEKTYNKPVKGES